MLVKIVDRKNVCMDSTCISVVCVLQSCHAGDAEFRFAASVCWTLCDCMRFFEIHRAPKNRATFIFAVFWFPLTNFNNFLHRYSQKSCNYYITLFAWPHYCLLAGAVLRKLALLRLHPHIYLFIYLFNL